MSAQVISIAIADDHPMVINGLKNMLQQYTHIRVIDTFPNGIQLLKGLKVRLPDILLLDIQMPDHLGVDLVPTLLKKYPDLGILALTNIDSVLYVYNMLKSGAFGYLLKTTSQEVLIRAIETVHRREVFLEDAMKERLDVFVAKMRRESSLKPALSMREKDILKLIVNGDTTKEIAEKLYLGFRTVESYRINILLKLDAKNTASLVRKVVELGILN